MNIIYRWTKRELCVSLSGEAMLCIVGYTKDSCIILGRSIILLWPWFGNYIWLKRYIWTANWQGLDLSGLVNLGGYYISKNLLSWIVPGYSWPKQELLWDSEGGQTYTEVPSLSSFSPTSSSSFQLLGRLSRHLCQMLGYGPTGSYPETTTNKLLQIVLGFSDFPRSPACLPAPVLQEDEVVSFPLNLPPGVFFFSHSHNCVKSNSSNQFLIPQQAQCFCLPVWTLAGTEPTRIPVIGIW